MPNYTYACLDCKRTAHIFHSIKKVEKTCPYCGGLLERAVCFDGYVDLKGAGFHKNDYPKGGEK
ncbi:MAG: hypothetical protein KAS32_21975 [Candidatus Peribacteraceae bacterium]|nr:hypothetical protein [Candidatus Peribacteraceae bacterium]